MRAVRVCALILSCVMPAAGAVHAQSTEPIVLAQQQQQQRSTNSQREQVRATMNENLLFIMGGRLGAGLIVMASDISLAVEDGDNLRVLPVVGGAGVQNVRDVVFLKGVDLGITDVLTLNKLRATGELGPNLDQQVAYIAPLFHWTMQVVARPEIRTVEDLRGKRVGFHTTGSATAEFSPAVFKMLNIDVQVMNMTQADALEKMRAGELDATVCTCPSPIPDYANLKAESGFKLVAIPYTPALEKASYYPSTIKGSEYPNLAPKDGTVQSIATASVLISFNWQPGSPRYARLAKFTDAFFSKFENLLKPPRHPLWKTVNLAGTIPGWRRFPAAQEWLDRANKEHTAALGGNFRKFIAEKASQLKEDTTDPAVQERLFKQFMEWSQATKAR
jgi:TRAP-type uncharacterized transport system substrate-binding protein